MYIVKSLVFTLIFLNLTVLSAVTQNNNIEDFSDKLIVKTYFAIPSVKLAITEYDNNDFYKLNNVTYKPNNYFDAGVAVNYKKFGISISSGMFLDKYYTRDEDKYGKSKNTNFQIFYYARKFGFDVYYQNYKGFYLVDPQKHGYDYNNSEVIRSDLEMLNIGANAYYVFSDNYSFSSSMNHTERQKKSGGSFLFMLSFGRLEIKSNYSLIPTEKQRLYDDYAKYTGGIYKSVALLPGYAYTIIYKNFFITPVLFLGHGIIQKEETFENNTNNDIKNFNKLNGRISVGYNGDDYFCGIFAINDTTSTRSWLFGSGTKISSQIIKIEFYVGVRF
jgi:hypothetical protein